MATDREPDSCETVTPPPLTPSPLTTARRTLSFPKLQGPFSLTEIYYSSTDGSRLPSPTYPDTPSLQETINIHRSLSYKTLKEFDAAQLRAKLWKPSHESEKRPKDLDQLIAWSIRGGTRAFLLAYSARSSFNLALVLFSALRKRHPRLGRAIINAVFGEASLRFGLMLGIFTGAYRWIFHGLRIWNPGPRGKGKEERWHAAVAGAISSLAILAERKETRVSLAQQIFVRALQGLYHRGKRRGLHIPNGDVWLFGLACGQIMYSWLMSPENLPKSYRMWITAASNMPLPLSQIQCERAHHRPFPIPEAEWILLKWKKYSTPNNVTLMKKAIEDAKVGIYGPPFSPCCFNHPTADSCVRHWIRLWPIVGRFMLPVYGALHFIPPLVLRRRVVMKDPVRFLGRATLGTLKSSSFLATFVFIYQSLVCSQRHTYTFFQNKGFPHLAKIIAHKYCAWLFGFMTCFSLFCEDKRRREELALYVLPKALESAWSTLGQRSLVPRRLKRGEVWLNMIGGAILMETWRHEKEALSPLVKAILFQTVY